MEEAEYTDSDWFGLETMAKHKLWSVTLNLRPNVPLELRRTRNVPATGKDSYLTELECCGKTLALAPMKNGANAEWLLGQWVKTLDPILAKYELKPTYTKPTTIDSPESFIQAVVASDKYKEL